MDHLARGFEIGALAEIVAAEADGGNAQAGAAEIANLHGLILWGERNERERIVTRAPSGRKVRSYREPDMGGGSDMQNGAIVRRKKMRPRSDAATDGDRWGA